MVLDSELSHTPRIMLIAQITDAHIKPHGTLAYGRVDTAPYLARAVAHLLALRPRPDVVLATGDLVDGGRPDEYRRLRDLLAPLSMPVYLIPGNHDEREALAAAFPDHTYLPRGGRFLQYVVDGYPVQLIGLDTLVPGQVGGRLCAERLGWLASRLVCAHLHRSIQALVGGTLATTAPSTAHQVALDLEDEPLSFTMEPPACQLHVWSPATGVVTHTSYIGEFDGPYLFASGARRGGPTTSDVQPR